MKSFTKQFTCVTVTRKDVELAFDDLRYSKLVAGSLTDNDMKKLARHIADTLFDGGDFYQEIRERLGDKYKSIKDAIQERLECLLGEINAERISYGEIMELQSLKRYIDKGDVQLLEWAGVPEK